MMTGSEARLAAGVDPHQPVTDGVLDTASPLQGGSLERMRALQHAQDLMQRESCMLRADFVDEGLLGLARSIQRAAAL